MIDNTHAPLSEARFPSACVPLLTQYWLLLAPNAPCPPAAATFSPHAGQLSPTSATPHRLWRLPSNQATRPHRCAQREGPLRWSYGKRQRGGLSPAAPAHCTIISNPPGESPRVTRPRGPALAGRTPQRRPTRAAWGQLTIATVMCASGVTTHELNGAYSRADAALQPPCVRCRFDQRWLHGSPPRQRGLAGLRGRRQCRHHCQQQHTAYQAAALLCACVVRSLALQVGVGCGCMSAGSLHVFVCIFLQMRYYRLTGPRQPCKQRTRGCPLSDCLSE